MDINPIPEHSEELQLGYLKPEQYFAAARQAAENLNWQIVSYDDHELMCHTPGDDRTYGESITIKLAGHVVLFHSRSVNEYYHSEGQNIINAELFNSAVAGAIEKKRAVEKSLKFFGADKLGALVPSKTYLVTPLLIYINILVFVAMVVSGASIIEPETSTLLSWGGNFRSYVIAGQWWRLLTGMFLHSGILHLLMNMYALLYIGMFLEPLLGKIRFTAVYFLTGVCASMMSITFHSFNVCVGASGAIFGCYGVFLALLTTSHIERTSRNMMLRSILFFVVYNLVYGLHGNIDNAAHIGGVLSGFCMGYIYYPGLAKYHTSAKQVAVTSALVIAVTVLSAITLQVLPDNMHLYEQKMKEFAEVESLALEVYKMGNDTPKDQILYNIKDRGIYYWNEDISILNEIAKLDLPEKARANNEKLIQYCKLRIQVYNMMYDDVEHDNDTYGGDIARDNVKLEQMIHEVTGK